MLRDSIGVSIIHSSLPEYFQAPILWAIAQYVCHTEAPQVIWFSPLKQWEQETKANPASQQTRPIVKYDASKVAKFLAALKTNHCYNNLGYLTYGHFYHKMRAMLEV